MNQCPVCMSPRRGSGHGTIELDSGFVAAIKLKRLYGYVTFNLKRCGWAYWGCRGRTKDEFLRETVNVIITDKSGKTVLPPKMFFIEELGDYKDHKWSKVPGQNSLSPELVLSFFEKPKQLNRKTTFYVRFGEEELNKSNHDNQGKVCFDVYALYTPAIYK